MDIPPVLALCQLVLGTYADSDCVEDEAVMKIEEILPPLPDLDTIGRTGSWLYSRQSMQAYGLACARAAAVAALDEAVKECEQKWREGYRGDVVVGFAHVIRRLRDRISTGESE